MPAAGNGLYEAIEEELKRSTQPMDCVELYEKAHIRKLATSANRVSDYLGNLWRQGLVVRLPAPRRENSNAKWMYSWKGKKPTPKPTPDEALPEFVEPKLLLQRPSIEIRESGSMITIELPKLIITIKTR